MASKTRTKEAITYGSLIIVPDNLKTSLPYNKPITGKIKVNLKTAFEAKAVTLSIRTYRRPLFPKFDKRVINEYYMRSRPHNPSAKE